MTIPCAQTHEAPFSLTDLQLPISSWSSNWDDLLLNARSRRYEIPISSQRKMLVYTPVDSPNWFEDALQKMAELLSLEENWDSYGAPRIDSCIVESVAQLLSALTKSWVPKPWICPTVRGGVQIEWHTNGIDIEIEYLSPTKVSVLSDGPLGEEEWEGRITENTSKIYTLLYSIQPNG